MRRQAETKTKQEDPLENTWQREISARVAEPNACLRLQGLHRERTKQNGQLIGCNVSAEPRGGPTMEEEKGVVVCKEKEGTENGGRDPFIVQVRTIRGFLTKDGPSHIKMESEDEIHQSWDSQRQELLKRTAGFPAAPSLLEEDTKDFLASLGRVKEDLQEGSSGKTGGKAVPQRDPNINRKVRVGRKKLDFCMKVKGEETLVEVDLESQRLLHLRQFIPQDAEEMPQNLEGTKLKPPKFEEEAFEIVKMHKKTFQGGRSEKADEFH
ncbi:uncharacterized protein LOC113450751 [Pseudonaja textilis]|uniref:uncharacterized protein LOC113450751 n=1 Tax=Pseudonaja textilis TaxID=8673 RepID=UPI000EA9C917|nr:uncharacterized protein LOC113450751 [Pseudonaja textilis]